MNTPNTDAVNEPAAKAGIRSCRAWLHRLLKLLWMALLLAPVVGHADHGGPSSPHSGALVTANMRYWVDPTGTASFAQVQQRAETDLKPLGPRDAFELGPGALWLRYDRPLLDATRRWYLVLEGAAFTNRAEMYQENLHGEWQRQVAGDRVPMAQWSHPDRMPVFSLESGAAGTVWLRLENHPAPLSPGIRMLDEQDLQARRDLSLLSVGVYLGFGLLVLFLGWVHVRLYGDRVFIAYVSYVACMLGFQVAFTGLGGLLFWPESPRWNDMAPALFMLWLTASGIWFVREVSALSRHSRGLYRLASAWSVFGFVFPAAYFLWSGPLAFQVLNLYGLLSVLLSMGLCVWAWRKGEVHAGWTALGFLPLHLAYPFPALRAAGLLPDSWITQYAVLIGSAIEIPLLLYILHRRAKDFNENSARMRAIRSTDPLTGLTIPPVLLVRLDDALRRARRNRQACALVLVELANHADIVERENREMGDRALVVAAAQLSALVRDIDTVCRVSDTRFAVLLEAPYRPVMLKAFAQHVIARGLAGAQPLPLDLSPRFRVVTVALPDWTGTIPTAEEMDVTLLLDHVQRALDELDPKKAVLHLPQSTNGGTAAQAQAAGAS